jgi:hypothetical protein
MTVTESMLTTRVATAVWLTLVVLSGSVVGSHLHANPFPVPTIGQPVDTTALCERAFELDLADYPELDTEYFRRHVRADQSCYTVVFMHSLPAELYQDNYFPFTEEAMQQSSSSSNSGSGSTPSTGESTGSGSDSESSSSGVPDPWPLYLIEKLRIDLIARGWYWHHEQFIMLNHMQLYELQAWTIVNPPY